MRRLSQLKIAIVHDFLVQWGGAENVVDELCGLFPDASVYTSMVDRSILKGNLLKKKIQVSFLQYIPLARRLYKAIYFLYPIAFWSLPLKRFHVILSSSTYYAKGVRKNPGALHVNYCHTPMRLVWQREEYLEREGFGPFIKGIIRASTLFLKKWDISVNTGVNYFVANSKNVADRIGLHYRRNAAVIFPPVHIRQKHNSKPLGNHYLVLSRLKAYKRIDLPVDACSRLNKKLVVIGKGEALEALKLRSGPTIEFKGFVPDEGLEEYVLACRALIFPGEEDFGITPLEIQACGKPVIAFGRGGALETVIPNETGLFFHEQTVDALCEAIVQCESMHFSPEKCIQNAHRFAAPVFREKYRTFVEEKIALHFFPSSQAEEKTGSNE